ncbi:hypothetical protein DMENIID0001_109290 [Sergentomyia squamirostris]
MSKRESSSQCTPLQTCFLSFFSSSIKCVATFIVIVALIAVSVQAYPAEEPSAAVEIHPRDVPVPAGPADVAVAPEGEEGEAKEGLNPSESAWGWGYGGGWRHGWGGGWGGWGGWGGYYRPRYYGGWGRSWGYPRYYGGYW